MSPEPSAATSGASPSSQPVVVVDNVSKTFVHRTSGKSVHALREIHLSLGFNEVVCLVGASGCGKSTLLNLIAGFETPTDGQVILDGSVVSRPGPERGVVFQDHGLFPWLTVADNVKFGPRARGVKVSDSDVHEILSLVGVSDFAKSFPHELSGGMRQRVALARTLLNEPRILLMDEPFGALDALTRLRMQEMLARIMEERPRTVLFITHDIEEALLLGDRVIVMSAAPGRLEREFEIGLERPRTMETLEDPLFISYRREITDLLMH